MGAVYEARHMHSGQRVAVKVLLAHFAHQTEVVSRFFNEARAMSAIDHPGIVRVIDMGRLPDATTYMVMEYVQGETLNQRIKRVGPLSTELALVVGRTVGEALMAAHARGVVHRDLKPDNIMLAVDAFGNEHPKVLDFGIAKIAQDAELGSGLNAVQTKTGMVLGTPAYMSPEQCRGQRNISPKTDVYSAGAVLFHMFAGRQPFLGGVGEVIAAQVYEPPPDLTALVPGVPLRIVTLINWMMRKAPEERPSMVDVVEELGRLQRGEPSRMQPGVSATIMSVPGSAVTRQAMTVVRPGGPIAPPQSHSRAGLLIGLVVLFVGAATGIGLFMIARARSQPELPPPNTIVAPTVPAPRVALPEVVTPPAQPAGGGEVLLLLGSKPPGADVIRVSDGTVLCRTPCNSTEPRGGKVPIRVHKSGFQDLLLDLDLSKAQNQQQWTLTAKSKTRRDGDKEKDKADDLQVVPLN